MNGAKISVEGSRGDRANRDDSPTFGRATRGQSFTYDTRYQEKRESDGQRQMPEAFWVLAFAGQIPILWIEAAVQLEYIKRRRAWRPEMSETNFAIEPIGVIRSELAHREGAPRQGYEGAPEAWLEMKPKVIEGLAGIAAGDELILITWLHKARRNILKLHPRGDKNMPLSGVFATRSPDRPNPLGLHRVTVLAIAGNQLRVGPLEAIDGTPVVDIKPVLRQSIDT